MAFKRPSGSNRKESRMRAGDDLIREFIGSLDNKIMVLSLKQVAEQNEQHTVDSLAAASGQGTLFITPKNIPQEQQATIARESLNAHMQKMQSQQAEVFNVRQQQTKNQELNERYKGRKIIVRVITRNQKPVITYWHDHLSGKRRGNEHAPQRLVGTIEHINLGGNTITVKPGIIAKSMNRALQFHQIYIVNPDDMTPLVALKVY